MTSAPATRNAFTDAPELHPNLILGSLQLLFWLFVHPSAWRSHVARIDPALRPGFTLAELNRAHWCNPLLRRLLIMGASSAFTIGITVGLALWASGWPSESMSVQREAGGSSWRSAWRAP